MDKMNRLILKLFVVIVIAGGMPLVLPQCALAQDVTQNPEQEGHGPKKILQVTPYLWAAGLEGDISPFRRLPTVNTQKSFSDVMEKLHLGGFLNVWGRSDNFVLSGDIMYVNTIDSRTIGPLPPLPGVAPGTTVNGSVDTKQFMATFQGGYRVYKNDGFTIDALAGGRFWQISNEVTVSAGNLSRSYSEHFNWLDPVIGTRVFVPVSDKLSVQGHADIGGFGVGSDFTWSALATLNYTVTDYASLSAGYKSLTVDYSNDGYTYDVQLRGPVLGATFRF